MFVMIQNRGEIPLWGIRVLGRSNKKEDQIGKFGSGAKEAIVLFLREGIKPIIFSGTTRVDFDIQEVDGYEEVSFKLSEDRDRFRKGEWYGMGLDPSFGKHDWKDLWQGFREFFCNALDEGEEFMHYEMADSMSGVSGATRVYIPASKPEVYAVFGGIKNKILHLNKSNEEVCNNKHGRILEPLTNKLSIYHKKIWVQENEKPSVFDYDLHNLKLNESRSADWYLCNLEIYKTIVEASPEVIGKILLRMRDEGWKEFYEHRVMNSCLAYYPSYFYGSQAIINNWRTAWTNAFGEDAVLSSPGDGIYNKIIKLGKKPIVLYEFRELRTIFQRIGIPEWESVLLEGDDDGFDIQECKTCLEADRIWEFLEKRSLTRNKPKPKVIVFKGQSSRCGTEVLGRCHKGMVWINQSVIGSLAEVETLLEEYGHYITDAEDGSRDFVNFFIRVVSETIDEVCID